MAATRWLKYGVWIFVLVLALVVIISAITITSFGGLETNIQKYVFFGTEDMASEIGVTTLSGEIGGLITALMIWLIIFVAFGDIIENWSAFSQGIGWIIAFALAVVGANTGLIQAGVIKLVNVFIWAGTAAIFLALLSSFFAFFAVSWGMRGLTKWIRGRQIMLEASTGRSYATEGLKTLTRVGKETTKAGESEGGRGSEG